MTSNEVQAHEVLERLIDCHPDGWAGVEPHGDLLAIGAVGHGMARLWRSAEEMARDLAERLGRGGMRPVAFGWRGDNWCILARPASPPVPRRGSSTRSATSPAPSSSTSTGGPWGPA